MGAVGFPLGGYVKMLDEREAPVAPAELHAFNRQNVWRRIAIVAAGHSPISCLAVVLYWGLYAGGVELASSSRCRKPAVRPKLGFQDGELVRAVDGEPVDSWQDFPLAPARRGVGPSVSSPSRRSIRVGKSPFASSILPVSTSTRVGRMLRPSWLAALQAKARRFSAT